MLRQNTGSELKFFLHTFSSKKKYEMPPSWQN